MCKMINQHLPGLAPGGGGWTDALTDPLKFEYTFHIESRLDEQMNLTKHDVITYDVGKMKAVINAATVNDKDIVLSGSCHHLCLFC